MSDAKNHGSDDLPELPDDSVLEELETLEPLAELPDDIEELPDDVMELPDEVEPLHEEIVPAAKRPSKSQHAEVIIPKTPTPQPAKPKPAAAKPKPAVAKPAANKPPTKKAAPAKVAKPAAAKPTKLGADDGGEKKKLTPEEREAAKKEREAQRKLELDRAAGRTGEKRELDGAPLVLRKASVVMGIGAVIPFATVAMDLWPAIFIGKALILLGGWIFHQSHVHNHGGKVPGFIASLAKGGPKVVYAVFGLLALVGLWHFGDSGAVIAKYKLEGLDADLLIPAIVAEKIILLLCLFTYTHIYEYEHGGKFNPIFPLMYLGGAVGGLGAIVRDLAPTAKELDPNYIAAAGAAAVCAGGCMAMWTMWLALKEAKVQGEQKKAAAAEARKAAREARKK